MAQASHTNLSSKIGTREAHFTLQQIRLIGSPAGLSDGSFSLPLNVLTREEIEERLRRIRESRDRMLKEMAERSFKIGQDINEANDLIDKKLDKLNRQIDKAELANRRKGRTGFLIGLLWADQDDDYLDKLRERKSMLERLKERLQNIDTERLQAVTIAALTVVGKQVADVFKELKDNYWPSWLNLKTFNAWRRGHATPPPP